MSIIKTNFELPRAENTETQAKRLAQDLSLNFKAIKTSIDEIVKNVNLSISGEVLSSSYSYNAASFSGFGYTDITLNHTLGVTPSGFIVSDITSDASPPFNSQPCINRVSWTSTQITVRIGSFMQSSQNITGVFKIIVLR